MDEWGVALSQPKNSIRHSLLVQLGISKKYVIQSREVGVPPATLVRADKMPTPQFVLGIPLVQAGNQLLNSLLVV